MHVAVVDIGKLENLGWAVEGPAVSRSGSNIDECVDALTNAIEVGPLAVGFEAPMFVPYREEVDQLDRCRNGEGDRAFSASAGACVLAKGLVICPFILASLRRRAPNANATFDWRRKLLNQEVLFFEAFVTHETADHIEPAVPDDKGSEAANRGDSSFRTLCRKMKYLEFSAVMVGYFPE